MTWKFDGQLWIIKTISEEVCMTHEVKKTGYRIVYTA